MTVRIRLQRHGAKKRPFYRVVAADQKAPRDGRFIELLGTYDPLQDPPLIRLKKERVGHWLSVGAQPSETAHWLITQLEKGAAIDLNQEGAEASAHQQRAQERQAEMEASKKKAAAEGAKIAQAAKEAEAAAAAQARAEAEAKAAEEAKAAQPEAAPAAQEDEAAGSQEAAADPGEEA